MTPGCAHLVWKSVLPIGGEDTEVETLIVTGVEVVLFPAASRAIAVSVWLPFAITVVSQDTEKGEDVTSAPKLFPSSLNCTPTTPMLSEAAADTVSTFPVTVFPAMGAVIATVGGVVSGPGGGEEPSGL